MDVPRKVVPDAGLDKRHRPLERRHPCMRHCHVRAAPIEGFTPDETRFFYAINQTRQTTLAEQQCRRQFMHEQALLRHLIELEQHVKPGKGQSASSFEVAVNRRLQCSADGQQGLPGEESGQFPGP